MSTNLSANFSFCFDGKIWNMLLDSQSGTLILEIREEDKHQVSFTAIDLNSGEVLWDGLQFEDNWWVGMTLLTQGILILRTFADNADPEPKGLIAFDILKKEVCWSKIDFVFVKIYEDKIIGFVRHDEERIFQAIGLTDGVVESIDEASVFEPSNHNEKLIEHSWPLTYPLHYVEGTEYFETCKTFLYNRLHLEAVKAIEYLEIENRIFISFYAKDGVRMVNYLLVIDLSGEIVFKEIIQKNINAIGLQTFFIVKNQVIFVKEKNEIFSFNL